MRATIRRRLLAGFELEEIEDALNEEADGRYGAWKDRAETWEVVLSVRPVLLDMEPAPRRFEVRADSQVGAVFLARNACYAAHLVSVSVVSVIRLNPASSA